MIYIVTGSPGAGKSLYCVSRRVREILGGEPGSDAAAGRRLVVGGIPDLLLDHVVIDVPEFDPESRAAGADLPSREPGEPAIDVEHRGDNWWLWCQPGDLIVIDECQRLFRPTAAGKRVPEFIARLERHRHYGVDFLLITQHPMLIHTNVRNLAGSHEHLSRKFGRGVFTVHAWDHTSHPDRVKNAVARTMRHDKKAFGLYKSAELHTKPSMRVPRFVYFMPFVLLALGFSLWKVSDSFGTLRTGPASHELAASPAQVVASFVPSPLVDKATPAHLRVAGGYCYQGQCRCYGQNGFPNSMSSEACSAFLLEPPPDYWRPADGVPKPPSGAASAPTMGGMMKAVSPPA